MRSMRYFLGVAGITSWCKYQRTPRRSATLTFSKGYFAGLIARYT